MYLPFKASRARQREAEKARENRAEIVKALSHGQITRRDLYRWGIFTMTGALALKNGLSPFARSAFARCPDRHAAQPARHRDQIHPADAAARAADARHTLTQESRRPATRYVRRRSASATAKRLSYHTEFTDWNNTQPGYPDNDNPFRNPLTSAVRSRAGRPAKCSRISAGTSSSPRSAT